MTTRSGPHRIASPATLTSHTNRTDLDSNSTKASHKPHFNGFRLDFVAQIFASISDDQKFSLYSDRLSSRCVRQRRLSRQVRTSFSITS